jgi:cysteinyl-tRNA synthetase
MTSQQTLRIYNTLTRTKQDFVPIDADNVRMYVCGPTVYDYAHIGNARPVIVFDVLFRLLRHLYGEDHVTYVRNITDVDDKINARAAERGISIRELTEETAKIFHEDVAALGCLPPTVEPRATEHIAEMIAVMQKLIDKGHAYAADGHVLFSVPSMQDYGQLARRSLDEMIAGARVEVASYKKSETDFVLWKPSKDGEPGWDSPWGRGRPGWHLECSAMSWKHLGETFDIHGGGIDLVFPHHENEIAQSRCAFGHDVMANYWLHNGFLQVEGEKMSKSLGNFITIRQLLDEGWDGRVLRLLMLKTHYRQPINWTRDGLRNAALELHGFRKFVLESINERLAEDSNPVIDALADDLNTPSAIASLHALGNSLAGLTAADEESDRFYAQFRKGLDLLGFGDLQDFDANKMFARLHYGAKGPDESKIASLIAARLEARKQKNWAESDRIRDELAGMGIQLKDAKNPETGEMETTWEVKR